MPKRNFPKEPGIPDEICGHCYRLSPRTKMIDTQVRSRTGVGTVWLCRSQVRFYGSCEYYWYKQHCRDEKAIRDCLSLYKY